MSSAAFKKVDAGEFVMGGDPDKAPWLDEDHIIFPPRKVHVDTYFIGTFPVTMAEWEAFLAETEYEWDRDVHLAGLAHTSKHPVVNVSWHDCMAYCEWLSRTDGKTY